MPPYGSALRRGEWESLKELRQRDPSGGLTGLPSELYVGLGT